MHRWNGAGSTGMARRRSKLRDHLWRQAKPPPREPQCQAQRRRVRQDGAKPLRRRRRKHQHLSQSHRRHRHKSRLRSHGSLRRRHGMRQRLSHSPRCHHLSQLPSRCSLRRRLLRHLLRRDSLLRHRPRLHLSHNRHRRGKHLSGLGMQPGKCRFQRRGRMRAPRTPRGHRRGRLITLLRQGTQNIANSASWW